MFAVTSIEGEVCTVVDTEDGVAEKYTSDQLFDFSRQVKIYGVDSDKRAVRQVSNREIIQFYNARVKLSGLKLFHIVERGGLMQLITVDVSHSPILDLIIPFGVEAIHTDAFVLWHEDLIDWSSEFKAQTGYFLRTIRIPSTVETIHPETFRTTGVVREIVLSEGIRAIGYDAFKQSSIERFIAPSTLASVGEEAFADCTRLSYLNFEKTKMTLNNFGDGSLKGVRKVYFPRSCFEKNNGEFLYRWEIDGKLNRIFDKLNDFFGRVIDLSTILKRTKEGYLLELPKRY